MATVPIGEALISVREYLSTSYSPDREYVDGRIVERSVGESGIPCFRSTSRCNLDSMRQRGAGSFIRN
jgi:hypothetical protein